MDKTIRSHRGGEGGRATPPASPLRWLTGLPLLALALALLVGCSAQAGNLSSGGYGGNSGGQYSGGGGYGGQYAGGTATGDTQEGAAFAQWVLQQDPQRQYLTDAVVRGDQTLGVKVQPNITKADTQRLLTSLAQGMSRQFPNRPITVDAFYQSGDKLAEALYDPRTGQTQVQFAR